MVVHRLGLGCRRLIDFVRVSNVLLLSSIQPAHPPGSIYAGASFHHPTWAVAAPGVELLAPLMLLGGRFRWIILADLSVMLVLVRFSMHHSFVIAQMPLDIALLPWKLGPRFLDSQPPERKSPSRAFAGTHLPLSGLLPGPFLRSGRHQTRCPFNYPINSAPIRFGPFKTYALYIVTHEGNLPANLRREFLWPLNYQRMQVKAKALKNSPYRWHQI